MASLARPADRAGKEQSSWNLGHSEAAAILKCCRVTDRGRCGRQSWHGVSLLFVCHSRQFLRLLYEASTSRVPFSCHNTVLGELGVHTHSIVFSSAESL